MDPLSKSKIKYIKSLRLKKYRDREGVFVVEGAKAVQEYLNNGYEPVLMAGTEAYWQAAGDVSCRGARFWATPDMLAGAGTYQTNNTVLAVLRQPVWQLPDIDFRLPVLALDRISDPGNLGTIIRLADWFGITQVVLGRGTVEAFNPKVVHAAKGSLARVRVYSANLTSWLGEVPAEVVAADLEGAPLTGQPPMQEGVLLLGSEAHGIDPQLAPYITRRVTIPGAGRAESLNVAVAAGVICYQLFGRRQ